MSRPHDRVRGGALTSVPEQVNRQHATESRRVRCLPRQETCENGSHHHDADHDQDVGWILENEGRVAVAAEQEIAQRFPGDCWQHGQDEGSPKIVSPLLRAHETGEAERRRSDVVPENSIRWDSRGQAESAHHPM